MGAAGGPRDRDGQHAGSPTSSAAPAPHATGSRRGSRCSRRPASSSGAPYQDNPSRHEYSLTDSGAALVPVLDALLAWGLEHAVAQDDPDRMRALPHPEREIGEDAMTLTETRRPDQLGRAPHPHGDLVRPDDRRRRRGCGWPGIDYLRAIRRRRAAAGADRRAAATSTIAEVEEGRVSFTCRPDESAYNPIGVVHGGLVCTLLDSVCRLRRAQHAAAGQGLHLDRDQGELPQGGHRAAAACSPRPAPWSRPARGSRSARAS